MSWHIFNSKPQSGLVIGGTKKLLPECALISDNFNKLSVHMTTNIS